VPGQLIQRYGIAVSECSIDHLGAANRDRRIRARERHRPRPDLRPRSGRHRRRGSSGF